MADGDGAAEEDELDDEDARIVDTGERGQELLDDESG
jgi:hypothetical protein